MPRILVEQARHKKAAKFGGVPTRLHIELPPRKRENKLIRLDEALTRFEAQSPVEAGLEKLRFFAGLTISGAAQALGISEATADNDWACARCWLRLEIEGRGPNTPS